MEPTPLLLLDLHYTFAIDETWHRGTSLATRIPREKYRTWIIDLIKANGATVLMTTARPEMYLEETLARIRQQTGWQPDGTYFRQIAGVLPHETKEDSLKRIIADYGDPQPHWVAFESNARTRSMYKRYGIYSLPVHRLATPLTAWPLEGMSEPKQPFSVP